MISIIGAFVGVWAILFAAWSQISDIVPPGVMTQEEYAIQYMIVGAVVCLVGAVAANMWFSAARTYSGRGSLGPKYRGLMLMPLLTGCLGTGYLLFLGAEDAAVNYIFCLLGGLLVYIIAACIGTPAAGKKYPPFG